jgi:hypothetical protein
MFDKKYEQFIDSFNSLNNGQYSFSEDLYKINKILLSLNQSNLHNMYKIIKLSLMINKDKPVKAQCNTNRKNEIIIKKEEHFNLNVKRINIPKINTNFPKLEPINSSINLSPVDSSSSPVLGKLNSFFIIIPFIVVFF